jgi:hypothetical protein
VFIAVPIVPSDLWVRDLVIEHMFPVEDEAAVEGATLQQQRQPDFVIRPHLLIGNGIEIDPQGRGFVGFFWYSCHVVGSEHPDVDRVTVDELKEKLPTCVDSRGSNAQLLADLPNRAFQRGLPIIETTPWTVDLPSSETSFLVDQEYSSILNDEQ